MTGLANMGTWILFKGTARLERKAVMYSGVQKSETTYRHLGGKCYTNLSL